MTRQTDKQSRVGGRRQRIAHVEAGDSSISSGRGNKLVTI